MSKSGSVFQIDDVTRTMSKGGGCAWCSTHPSSDPPPPPGWLATGLICKWRIHGGGGGAFGTEAPVIPGGGGGARGLKPIVLQLN